MDTDIGILLCDGKRFVCRAVVEEDHFGKNAHRIKVVLSVAAAFFVRMQTEIISEIRM